jgi:hypothetical protein
MITSAEFAPLMCRSKTATLSNIGNETVDDCNDDLLSHRRAFCRHRSPEHNATLALGSTRELSGSGDL